MENCLNHREARGPGRPGLPVWVAIRLIGQLADARQGLWFLTSNQKKQQRLVACVCLVRREGPHAAPFCRAAGSRFLCKGGRLGLASWQMMRGPACRSVKLRTSALCSVFETAAPPPSAPRSRPGGRGGAAPHSSPGPVPVAAAPGSGVWRRLSAFALSHAVGARDRGVSRGGSSELGADGAQPSLLASGGLLAVLGVPQLVGAAPPFSSRLHLACPRVHVRVQTFPVMRTPSLRVGAQPPAA